MKKLKILHVSNNPNPNSKEFEKVLWNNLLYPLKQKAKVLDLGKPDLLKFYYHYLKFKPDIIVSTWIPAGFIPVLFKKIGLVKCPVIHRWEDYYTETLINYPKPLISFMEIFTAKNADYIITVLKTLYDKARKIRKNENTVFLLPYGTTPGAKKTNINLNKHLTKKSNIKVIYAGEINSKYKGVDKIIKACKGENCELFLFGEQLNKDFQNLIKSNKNIHYMGWCNPEELIDLLKQGDILVNPSEHEISMKFLDYIKAERPILASNKKPSKFFKHKETAYLTDNFKKGLKELIKNPELRKKIQKNMTLIKIYSWDKVADIHLKLYKKILNKEPLKEFQTSYYHVSV